MAEIFRVPKVDNYTIISNMHFKDRRLSLRAKGLLSLILSLPDSWDLTLKGLVSICTEGRDAVSNTIKELQTYGYIKKLQPREKNGKLQRVIYEIHEKPIQEPGPENPEAVEDGINTDDLPLTEKPLTDSPVPGGPLTVDPTQLRTKETKDLLYKGTYQSIQDDVGTMIKENIEYEILINRYDKGMIDAIVQLLCTTISCQNPVLKIGKREIDRNTAIEILLSLEFEHIEFVMDQFKIQTARQKIKNVREYLLTMLFNAPSSMELYYNMLYEQTSS